VQTTQAKIQTNSGIQEGNLLPETTIAQWLPQDNPDLAQKFLTLGVRAGMHWLAGYSVTSSALQQFNLPQTYSEAMRLAADEMEARERAEAENKRLTAQVTEDAPKVQAYEQLINSDDNVEMKDFADTLNVQGLGRNKLIQLLRDRGVFTPDNRGVGCTPYRRYIDAGYFDVNEKSTRVGIKFYTVITPKGQDWMLKQLRKWEILPAAS
jgi:phage antirepressor YoqD-like protein